VNEGLCTRVNKQVKEVYILLNQGKIQTIFREISKYCCSTQSSWFFRHFWQSV